MSVPFLLFANLVLVLRLPLLLTDTRATARWWSAKAAVEVAFVCAAFELAPPAWGLIAAIAAVNAAEALCARAGKPREGQHLLLGSVELAAASVLLSPKAGVAVRALWPADLERASHWSALGGPLADLVTPGSLAVAFGLLLAANEANLAIRWVLNRLRIQPGGARRSSGRPAAPEPEGGASGGEGRDEYNRGRVIGLLERGLIFVFVLAGHYGVIGFTLAAKAFTRFKNLDDQAFAEYVLIGTLLSSSLAMLAALFVRALPA